MKPLATLLILSGCATESLEQRAMTCEPPEDEKCIQLRELADRRAERNQNPSCPPNYIVYIDDWGNISCVTREDFDRWRIWNF